MTKEQSDGEYLRALCEAINSGATAAQIKSWASGVKRLMRIAGRVDYLDQIEQIGREHGRNRGAA
jgi:hypothetical protein